MFAESFIRKWEDKAFKKGKSIIYVDYPVLPPEKSEKDYRLSKKQNKCILGTSKEDSSGRNETLDLMFAKREYRNVNEKLKIKRVEAAKQYELNNEKWVELEQKQQNLRASFIRFEKFVLENDDKRKRARLKIAEDKMLYQERCTMLEHARRQQIELSDVKGKLDLRTKEYRIYEDYLHHVVSSIPQHFRSIQDVIKRHAILIHTKSEVAEKRDRDIDALDRAKTEFAALVDEKELAIMMLNSQLVQLIVRHERAQTKALMWENIVSQVRDITAQKERELSSVHFSLWNMYKTMCKRKNVPLACARKDFSGQLMFVKKSLFELNKICQRLEAHARSVNVINKRKIKFQQNVDRISHTSTSQVLTTRRTGSAIDE